METFAEIDRDAAYQRWEAAYKLRERERLRERYASHQRELAFYESWRRKNPVAKWEPEFFVDES